MRAGYLGRDEHAVADASHRRSHHVLGSVHLGGIDQGRSEFNPPPQRVNAAAVAPYADPNLRHHHAGITELLHFHS